MQLGDTLDVPDAWWLAFLKLWDDLSSFVVPGGDKELEDFLSNALVGRFCELPQGEEEQRLFHRVFFEDGELRRLDEDDDSDGWITTASPAH